MILGKKILKVNKGYYFPLFNGEIKSSITPNFLGDIKRDYHSYLLEPVSERDLYESYGRHMIFYIDELPYYLSGKGINQQEDLVEVTYHSLYQEVKRINKIYTIETNSFVPLNYPLEMHQIKYTNTTNSLQKLKVVVATPLYGRSAENLFDHRHVTSLLNEIEVLNGGIILKPTLSFDERGHLKNELFYGGYVNSLDLEIDKYYPTYDDFIDGGSLLYPRGFNNGVSVGSIVKGYEGLVGISFKEVSLKPLESISFYVGYSISKEKKDYSKLLNEESFNKLLIESNNHFEKLFKEMEINYLNKDVSDFLRFVNIQPTLRRIFGNSFLPHHDYGKGGRGFRDLFQDLLYLIFTYDSNVKEMLVNNFKGIRIDGSNATIIGNNLGEFKADRNNIIRVWSDHGAWPLYTLNKYINYFNDYEILLEEVEYFDDKFTHFTKEIKTNYPSDNKLRNKNKVYKGTILEHLLIENIVGSLNLGKEGFVRLEDADWNDGLDMANDKGETIAFTHFYINNLKILVSYLKRYQTVTLFTSLKELINKMDKESLFKFFDKVSNFDEEVNEYQTVELIISINNHIKKLMDNINKKALLENGALQSYIDNDGNYLDENTVTLTGQAMALLNETVSYKRAHLIKEVTRERLFNDRLGGYQLNEDYKEVKMNLGRAYGFAYGHKENGAVFSHMSLMYISGLFNYGFVKEGREGLLSLINKSLDFNSNIPLGIPEYFNDKGLGKYFYLTGSATWLLKVIKEDLFGIKMKDGAFLIEPKLSKEDFINGSLSFKTNYFDKQINFIFVNEEMLDYGDYEVLLYIDGKKIENNFNKYYKEIKVIFKRKALSK